MEIELNKDDIIIFVGANNVGKSRSLKDIKEDLSGVHGDKIVIKEIEYNEENFDINGIKSYFEKNFTKEQYSNYNVQIDNIFYSFDDSCFNQNQTNFKSFYKVLFTMLSTENRLKMTAPVPLSNIDNRFYFNIMQNLETSDYKIKKLNRGMELEVQLQF